MKVEVRHRELMREFEPNKIYQLVDIPHTLAICVKDYSNKIFKAIRLDRASSGVIELPKKSYRKVNGIITIEQIE